MVFRRSSDVPTAGAGSPDSAAEVNVDGLTGLADRWQLEIWLGQHIARARRTSDRFAVLLISVSNLGEINSGYGSAVGDDVLQAVAESVVNAVGSRGQVARYLGGEFAVIWPGVFGADDARRAALDIVSMLPQQVTFESFVVPLEVVVAGVLSDHDSSERLLMVDAEATLHAAREERPRRKLVIRDEAFGNRTPEVLAVRLQRAFDNNEFRLYYQPIVSLNPRQGPEPAVVGFEAMLRWLSPDHTVDGAELITPGAFLDALRASPIVVPLHAWVLRESVRQVGLWSRQTSATMFSATNLDPTFVRDHRFVDVVMQAIAETGVRPNQVVLDINGHTAGPHINAMWPSLQTLKAEGVGIALEDFGVGYASPDLLRRCRFDVIRLPRVLVGGLGLAEEDRVIVKSLIDLAHALGCSVIAEGVETENQARILKALGCDLAQGYLFARAEAGETIDRDFEDLLGRTKTLASDL